MISRPHRNLRLLSRNKKYHIFNGFDDLIMHLTVSGMPTLLCHAHFSNTATRGGYLNSGSKSEMALCV